MEQDNFLEIKDATQLAARSVNLVNIDHWRQFLVEGEAYLGTARRASEKRKDVFTPEILYNLTAMAIEKYLMAFLMYHGDMADNHTMRDLINSVSRHTDLPPELTAKLLHLDSFQEICDMDGYNRRAPQSSEIADIIAVGATVSRMVRGKLGIN